MPTMNISITPELYKIVQDKVKSGMYNNASEFVREAIRQTESTGELLMEIKMQKLRQLLAPALAQAAAGDFADYSLEDVLAEIDDDEA